MALSEKACPVVIRAASRTTEVLAFLHPTAGRQFVKGTIEKDEEPIVAARRELREESGIVSDKPLKYLGKHGIGVAKQSWYFFVLEIPDLPETWNYKTEDDFGHIYKFFWHPIDLPLNADWHSSFHEAYNYFSRQLENADITSKKA